MTWLYHSLCNLARFSFISMTVRERRPCVLKAPSWRSKRLLTQDETLQTFSWPYDTGAFINEMKHVSEIVLSLSLPSLPLSKYCVCALSL